MESNRNGFDTIFDYVTNKDNEKKLKSDVFTLVFQSKTFKAKFYAETLMDNGLNHDDPNYKEYQGIYFKNIESNKFIEISKSKSPIEVYINGEKIY